MSRRYASAHPCPTPSKRSFASVDEAQEHYLAELARPEVHARGGLVANFAYRCPCGRWHRSSKLGSDGVRLDPTPARTV